MDKIKGAWRKFIGFMQKMIQSIKRFFAKPKVKKVFQSIWIAIKKAILFIFKLLKQPVIINSLLAIFFGLLVGFIVMWATAGSFDTAVQGLMRLLKGGSTNLQSFGNVLFRSAPLILVGLSVAFAFKTGLFNIGASGQYMVGGITALYIANLVTMPAPYHFILAALGAIVAGAIWGSVPGLLKSKFNVNEVITTIMMNYIATYLTVILAYRAAVYDNLLTAVNTTFPTANIPKVGLDTIFPNSNIDLSIIIAIGVAILIWFILKKTTLGYQLKAVGHSPEGSKYAGINNKRNVIISMMIAGALAGLAAAMSYLPLKPDYFRPVTKINPMGFEGISVALIAFSNPIGIIFSGVMISYIKQGALTMQFVGFNKEITNIITSVIIYMIAISSFIGFYFRNRSHKRKIKKMLLNKGGETDVS